MTRQELQAALAGHFRRRVDHNLNTAINKIREVLAIRRKAPLRDCLGAGSFVAPVEGAQTTDPDGGSAAGCGTDPNRRSHASSGRDRASPTLSQAASAFTLPSATQFISLVANRREPLEILAVIRSRRRGSGAFGGQMLSDAVPSLAFP